MVIQSLREFIETKKAKTATAESASEQLNTVLELLEQKDFELTEYNDIPVRQLIEKITVEDKVTIKVIFKGGFEIKKLLTSH